MKHAFVIFIGICCCIFVSAYSTSWLVMPACFIFYSILFNYGDILLDYFCWTSITDKELPNPYELVYVTDGNIVDIGFYDGYIWQQVDSVKNEKIKITHFTYMPERPLPRKFKNKNQ